MRVGPLDESQLGFAVRVLESCPFDRAADVAREKLFEAGPIVPKGFSPVHAFGAWEADELVGVAAVSGRWIRLIAVVPHARRRGVGSALLDACAEQAAQAGIDELSLLAQPGNYLAPGIDERNVETIAWLEKRGFVRGDELRTNVIVNVQGNPRVTHARLDELAAAASSRGYEIRRARLADAQALLDAVAQEFGGAWPHEILKAISDGPACGVHLAIKGGAICAFAAHDGNNRGLGWFGPTGVWPAHRGNRLGEVLLMACLLDVADVHAQCEIAWIGPREFYDKVAGIAGERRFVTMSRRFSWPAEDRKKAQTSG